MSRVQLIKQSVAKAFNVSLADLERQDRSPPVSHPRMAAYWIARLTTALSLPQLGAQFKRDHTTIISGIRRAEHLRHEREEYAERLFDALNESLEGLDDCR